MSAVKLYFSVMLEVELKEGGRLEWDAGQRFVREKTGNVQLATNEAIVNHVRGSLEAATEHDGSIAWRVVDVLEGSAVEVDGNGAIIVDAP